MQKTNRFLATLGSGKLTLVILAVFAVAIGTATFIETIQGTPAAKALVYNANWFELLLLLFVLNLTAMFFKRMPFRVHQTGFVITHIGFAIVLLGAAATRYFGYEGTMRIREGASTDFLYSSVEHVQLQVGDEIVSFPISPYKSGKMGVRRTLNTDGKHYTVALSEFWAHYEKAIVEGPGGSPVALLSLAGAADNVVLPVGERFEAGGVTVHFLGEDRQDVKSGTPYGQLVIDLGGERHSLAVPARPPAEIEAGGVRYRITEFAPNFRVGGTANPNDAMENPAIRVEISEPGRPSNERMLFAFHPDFDMGHAGRVETTMAGDLVYEYGRNVFLSLDGDALTGRADFAIDTGIEDGHDHGQTTIGAGERFRLPVGTTARSGAFAMTPVGVWLSGVERAVNSQDENLPAAFALSVEDQDGNRAEATVIQYADRSPIQLGGQTLRVGYGPIRIPLPYRLHLDDFKLITYPGSENPASFESHVRLYDDERGIDGERVRIYMNHPLDYRGFKHFQSSYDRDRRGTILSVNHDPGKWPTYLGYTVIGLGFLITLTRGAWYRKRTV